jgi:hypothetical protein
MHATTRRPVAFGWLVLGVWGGALIGDAVAVTAVIQPGYVRSVLSAPTLLTFRLTGACLGLCAACILDIVRRESPKPRHWLIWTLLSVAYWILVRLPFEMMARE